MKGKIKWFDEGKGYGFIKGSDGEEYFVHKSAFSPECKPFEGASVDFDKTDGRKGIKAINVRYSEDV